MRTKNILGTTAFAIIAAASLSFPVLGAEQGVGGSVIAAAPESPTNAPATGAAGTATGAANTNTAIPEIPATGAPVGDKGTPIKNNDASTADIKQSLSAMGYTNVESSTSSAAMASGQTHFMATNSKGKKVNLTVSAKTGTVIKETPAP